MSEAPTSSTASAPQREKDAKQERLAKALRDNLRRRKATAADKDEKGGVS